MRALNVLIAGYAAEVCEGVRGLLANQADLQARVRALAPPESDPLRGESVAPDVLIVVPGTRGEPLLQSLARLDAAHRPPTIVIGPTEDPQLMRSAIRAGAREYLVPPLPRATLIEAVQRLGRERAGAAATDAAGGFVMAVINVKGGSGASFVAANLAHVLATQGRLEAGLLDLDLQFGALPLAFDLRQPALLLEALAAAAQLDDTALRGYLARHKSGVNVLSAMSDQLALPWQISEESVVRLLEVMRRVFPVVIVDLPRQIDPLTSAVLTRAGRVLMVMQQSLAHVHDARRMQKLLTGTLSIPADRLMLLLNRHSDQAAVTRKDVLDTVQPGHVFALPNDFQTVSEALNAGEPVCERHGDTPIGRSLKGLAGELGLLPGAGAAAGGNGRTRSWREALGRAVARVS